MNDPRLNSVHLDPPRRAHYRRAREALYHACGPNTLAGHDPGGVPESGNTLIQGSAGQVPADVAYWLTDNRYVYPLRPGINTVGRSPENDVVLQDCYISRRHCAILVHGGNRCELHDTASKNGILVNGRKLSGPTMLRSGDEVRLCDLRLIFISRNAPPDRQNPTFTLPE
jgi:pSer/pThr/pTyr-binding forkhead associated (FHA) protein